MGYLTKSAVEKGIKKRVRKDRHGQERTDYEAYLGIDPFTQKPIRISRSDEKELRRDIADFYVRHKIGGDAAVRLTATQAIDASRAYDALAAANMNISLFDAVSAYIAGDGTQATSIQTKTAMEAFEEFYKTKPEGSNKVQTNATTGKWARLHPDRKLDSFTTKEIADYLERNYGKRKPKTYNDHLLYLNTFFNWCCKEQQNYLAKNPIKSLAPRPEPWEEPECMEPQDVERLFRLLEAHKADRPDMLAYATINFFCGSRAVEIQRMAQDDDAAKINLEDETIRIAKGKGFQLGRRPRAFHIEPTALAWMKSFDFIAGVKKINAQTQNDIYTLARQNDIPVFQNCGRHTFISYHVSAYGDPAKTQAIVGTSAKMRAENYSALASKGDGEAYFRILPSGK